MIELLTYAGCALLFGIATYLQIKAQEIEKPKPTPFTTLAPRRKK